MDEKLSRVLTMKFKNEIIAILAFVIFALAFIQAVSAVTYTETYSPGSWTQSNDNYIYGMDINLTLSGLRQNDIVVLRNVTMYGVDANPTIMYIWNAAGTSILKSTAATGTVTDMNYTMGAVSTVKNNRYKIGFGGESRYYRNSNGVFPYANTVTTLTGGCYDAPGANTCTAESALILGVLSYQIQVIYTPDSMLNVSVNNSASGVLVSGYTISYTTDYPEDTNPRTTYCAGTNCMITNFPGNISFTVSNITGGFADITANATLLTGVNNNVVVDVACTSNFVCEEYSACSPNGVKVCTNLTDTHNCGVPYDGSISDFNQECVYPSQKVYVDVSTNTIMLAIFIVFMIAALVSLPWTPFIMFASAAYNIVYGIMMLNTNVVTGIIIICLGLFFMIVAALRTIGDR